MEVRRLARLAPQPPSAVLPGTRGGAVWGWAPPSFLTNEFHVSVEFSLVGGPGEPPRLVAKAGTLAGPSRSRVDSWTPPGLGARFRRHSRLPPHLPAKEGPLGKPPCGEAGGGFTEVGSRETWRSAPGHGQAGQPGKLHGGRDLQRALRLRRKQPEKASCGTSARLAEAARFHRVEDPPEQVLGSPGGSAQSGRSGVRRPARVRPTRDRQQVADAQPEGQRARVRVAGALGRRRAVRQISRL